MAFRLRVADLCFLVAGECNAPNAHTIAYNINLSTSFRRPIGDFVAIAEEVAGSTVEAASRWAIAARLITPGGTGGFIVLLGAYRLGNGTGRLYTIKATTQDVARNTTRASASCTVPHDVGN